MKQTAVIKPRIQFSSKLKLTSTNKKLIAKNSEACLVITCNGIMR